MNSGIGKTSVVLIVILPLFLISAVYAQSTWLDYNARNAVALEILKIRFDEGEESFLSSTSFLTGRFSLSPKFLLVGEIPFAYYGESTDYGEDISEATLGNPYLGGEFSIPGSGIMLEFGARAPLVSENNHSAAFYGALSDRVERIEAFLQTYVPLSAFLNFIYEHENGFALRFRTGPAIWLPTEKWASTEVFLLYGAQAFYRINKVRFGAGFSGRYSITEEDREFENTNWYQLGFLFEVKLGQIQPAAYLRFPLDENLPEMMDFVFGIGLMYNFD